MSCRCDRTRGQSCGVCEGDPVRIAEAEDQRDYGDDSDRAQSRYERSFWGAA